MFLFEISAHLRAYGSKERLDERSKIYFHRIRRRIVTNFSVDVQKHVNLKVGGRFIKWNKHIGSILFTRSRGVRVTILGIEVVQP